MVLGDSTDTSRAAIERIKSDKIKIIDTIWDMNNRKGGKVFTQQANAGLDHITGDWAFHIQADEVIHENDLPKVLDAIKQNDADKRVEGLLFPFIYFWGNYDYIRNTRRVHKNEVRVVRNSGAIRSYRDSQGFRKYSGIDGYENGEKGEKWPSKN